MPPGNLEALCDMEILDREVPVRRCAGDGRPCAGMQISPFRIPHDCAEGLGYRVVTADGRTVVFFPPTWGMSRRALKRGFTDAMSR